MGDVNLVINMTFVFLGLYLIILAVRAKSQGFVHQNFLLDRTMQWSKCRDKNGFINYIYPRVIVCGFLMILGGGYIALADRYTFLAFPYYQYVGMLLIMACFVGYVIILKSAGDKFYR
ncbi:MAG: hypothetical protein II627_04205 [Lachnospiraceae bacterium]|nr:hypothetical protein [Lachnospiraceae bacterium]